MIYSTSDFAWGLVMIAALVILQDVPYIRQSMWRRLAWLLTRFDSASWLLAISRPYRHIYGPDGSLYMRRHWIFNPYDVDYTRTWKWLPSVRLHWIRRADSDRHLHDHPWAWRTIILKGWYVEERIGGHTYRREAGYTGTMDFGEFHRIQEVSPDGVWTLFITWRKQGTWGFLVDGVKVPYREYLGL
jgi:hypothetical protein